MEVDGAGRLREFQANPYRDAQTLTLAVAPDAVFFIDSSNLINLGADWKTWYAAAGLATFFLVVGIAIFAFWRSLGSRELFSAAAHP